MKQDDLSADYQNKAIEYCRALLDPDVNANPGTQSGTALALLTICDSTAERIADVDLTHFESGERFSVTFHKGDDAHNVEGAVILQGVDKPPVGVLVTRMDAAGKPVGNIARMGDEGEVADSAMRTGGEIADDLDPDRHREAPADDGTVSEGESGA